MGILAPNFADHRLIFDTSGTGRQAQVTFATQWESGTEGLQALTAAVAGIIVARMVPGMDASQLFVRVESDGMDGAGTVVQASTTVNQVGGVALVGPSANCAVLVRKRTGLAGRRNRGRMYWVGMLDESDLDEGGFLTAAALAAQQAIADNIFADLQARAATSDMVVLHSELPSVPALCTALEVDDQIGTQRRRMRVR